MTPPASQRQHIVLVDEDWAATLIGLPMMVPNSWWNGYRKDDNTLNPGTIVGVDFDQPHSNYFQLECGNEIYAMRYDAIFQYVDMDHATYNATKFRLPSSAPANPEHEGGVMIAPRKKKNLCSGMMRMMLTRTTRTTRTTRHVRIISPHRPNATNPPLANDSTKKRKRQSTLI